MATDRRRLPPLDYLVAFDAAARLGGFTLAAEELNLTQGAISRKIRLLEENLGKPLFFRTHRAVHLTDAGRRYHRTVVHALESIAKASAEVRQGDLRPRVAIAATQSVSTLWLLPRLNRLRSGLPGIEIELTSSDDDRECLESGSDLIILRGEGRWPGFEGAMLLNESICPVADPDYIAKRSVREPRDFLNCTLIDVASHHTEWLDWKGWLSAAGVDEPIEAERILFNTYALAIDAACQGLGVALGWHHLIDRHILEGRLVRPLPLTVETNSGYYLLHPRGRDLSPAAERISDWLRMAL
ncbi:transcriptional regulator, LysR family protein [Fulvimarina pelagi HTCC2506]|uniref:Transcriptional regulator, LysR family protein n=1 Tax=Fulvimarina pelagi HTCC2506 TaxID=314231 RepID=Q0G2U4_9HYPH|nr:LysR substrate-binding domain-containing protein [Fulvimarina pelagi]EAU42087.1 transcriptional regulator, LysR family protein [Fulvimarina pelagi HTCC2506]